MRGPGQFVNHLGRLNRQTGSRAYFGKYVGSKNMPETMNIYDTLELPSLDRETTTVDNFDFTPGELYIFYPEKHDRRPLWGVFDKRLDGRIRLESSSSDLVCFETWHTLPDRYISCRLSSRDELRDYTAALTHYECRRIARQQTKAKPH